MTHSLALPAALLALAACQPALPPGLYLGPPAEAGPEDCGATAILPLIGKDVSALPPTGPWGALRVIHPGMAVTEDYSPSRLNVMLDASDRIQSASCG